MSQCMRPTFSAFQFLWSEKMASERAESGEKIPKKVTSSNASGEAKRKMVAGVAMGKADSIGEREA